MLHRKLWLLVPALLLLVLPSHGDEQEERRKLQQLGAKIQKLQQSIRSSSSAQRKINRELQQSEQWLSAIQAQMNALSSEIVKLGERQRVLTRQKAKLNRNKSQQKQAIISEVRAGYRLGREQTLKLLLNQEDPAKVSRVLKYHDYFLQARAEKFAAYMDTLRELEAVETELATNKDELVAKRNDLSRQRDKQLALKQQRQQVLAKLQASLKTDEQRLDRLLLERKRLEAVIRELGATISNINLPDSFQPFRSRKGEMTWPADGKVKHRFGSRRNTRMKWDGWLIAAAEGSDVAAIHHGRVVFADYLRGQGMLVIIDHGDGYMSLYAHNQVVLKETGDWVRQGEAIAKIGSTGGLQQSALYFEIRHNGRPTNPGSWLKRT